MAENYHHGDLHDALIDATLEVVATQGIDAVKVSSLAKQLGVSSAAPFRHFRNRQELLVRAAEHAAASLQAAVAKAIETAESPIEAQRASGIAYVRFAAENRGHFRLLTRSEIIRDSELLQQMAASSQQGLDAILGEHQSGDASHELAKRTAGALAGQALMYGLASMVVDGLLGELSADDVERLAWEVTSVLGEGLGGPEPGE